MKAFKKAIDKFCYKHRRFGIYRLMMYIIGCTAAVFLISWMDTTGRFGSFLYFDAQRILAGEVWRIFTWVFLPTSSSLFSTAISLYFYFFIGSTLEQAWGTPRFNIYYLLGFLANVIFGMLVWLIGGIHVWLTPMYLNLSMFFAYAALVPNNVVMLFFILPIKVKWLAYVNAAFFALMAVRDLIALNFVGALLPVVAVLNFLIFCGSDVFGSITVRAKNRKSKNVINFKRAVRDSERERKEAPYRHKCAVCGKTDTSNPGLEFRYCSRCEGYHCFCEEHINNHVHFQ